MAYGIYHRKVLTTPEGDDPTVVQPSNWNDDHAVDLGWFDVKDPAYGAVGDGVTDDTTAIQAAIDACPAYGCVFVPKGAYLITGLTITKSIILRGVGFGSRFVVAASVGATTDAIHVIPAAGVGNGHYLILKDFAIAPASGTPGRYGIYLDGTNVVIQDSLIDNVVVYQLGDAAIYGDGGGSEGTPILTTIQRCTLMGGIVLPQASDTVRIRDNHIVGASGWGVNVTCVAGASTVILDGNSITSDKGVRIGGPTVAPQIIHNEFETFATATGSNGAYLDLDGDAGGNVYDAMIAHNSFQIVNGVELNTIRVNRADRTHIVGNRMSRGVGSSQELDITANATDTIIGENLWAQAPPSITDAGTNTFGADFRKKVYISNGASGTLTEVVRLQRAADGNRYNSIYSDNNDSGAASVEVRVHDGVSATSQVRVVNWNGKGRQRFLTQPPIYANNAAAAAGGLLVGEVYRTGGDPDALCVVHA